MKIFLWIFIGLIGVIGIITVAFSILYRSPYIATIPIEQYRKRLDETQNQLFIRRAALMVLLNRLYGNGDKYVFRAPRIIPTFKKDGTVQGYMIYAMVNSWNPQSHILNVNSYLGRPMSVRFDPDADGSMAVVPKLDNYGVADSVSQRDFVTTARDMRYNELFCYGDIVGIETPNVQQFSYASRGTPVLARSIQLSFRLCDK